MYLSNVQYIQPNIGFFPLLPGKGYFSWGDGSGNMQPRFGDPAEAQLNRQEFFTKLGLDLSQAIFIDPKHKDAIEAVTDNSVMPTPFGIPCDALITKTKRPLVLTPADCLGIILSGKTKTRDDIISLIHAGRRGLELRIIELVTKKLIELYGCDISAMTALVAPSIAQKHYHVRKEDLLVPEVWEGFCYVEGDNVFLDTLAVGVHQLKNAGFIEEHIQAYAVDTYEACERGESFSSRYATSTNQPEKMGRFMVVACLPSENDEKMISQMANYSGPVMKTEIR